MSKNPLPRQHGSRRVLALTATGALTIGALTACGSSNDEPGTDAAESSTATAADVLAENRSYVETAKLADQTWDAADEVTISLDRTSAKVSGGASDGVQVDGSTVTITKPGTYRVSGTLTDGQIVVDSPDDGVVRLVLDGADVTSSTGAAVGATDADQVSVVLAEGSTNRLEDARTYADTTSDDAPDAALYSTADMAISGGGALEVVGNATDGITGKDGLVVASGDITVTAADDAVRGKDYLVVTGGSIEAEAGGDGLKSDADDDAKAGYVALVDGSVTVTAGSDGVQGLTDVAVLDGSLTVKDSEEGVEAAVIAISGGTVDVTASDDGLNATVKEAEDESSAESTDEPADRSTDQPSDRATDAAPAPEGTERPAMPEGERPTMPEGAEPPATPKGERPAMRDGERPAMPDGERPDMPERSGTPEDDRGTTAEGRGGDASDMAVQEGAELMITGGSVHVRAGADAIDSNGTVKLSGGTSILEGPAGGAGEGALDANGTVTVSGATVLISGNPTVGTVESKAGWVTASLDAAAEAGAEVTVATEDGTELGTFSLADPAATVAFTSPEVAAGESYTVDVAGTTVTVTAEETLAGEMGGGPAGVQPPNGDQTPNDDQAPNGNQPPRDDESPSDPPQSIA